MTYKLWTLNRSKEFLLLNRQWQTLRSAEAWTCLSSWYWGTGAQPRARSGLRLKDDWVLFSGLLGLSKRVDETQLDPEGCPFVSGMGKWFCLLAYTFYKPKCDWTIKTFWNALSWILSPVTHFIAFLKKLWGIFSRIRVFKSTPHSFNWEPHS